MANLDASTIKLPQPYVEVEVDFYDAAEKQKLLNYPTAGAIRQVVNAGVRIPTEQFLTYYLFHKKRPGKPGWRNYDEVGGKIYPALAELREFVDFNGKSISTPRDVCRQERPITEHLGETIGLSVVNEIHGLTGADWDRVPGHGLLPIFDYELASDGAHTVQMEAKGCSTSDNALKPASVSNQKADIVKKNSGFPRHRRAWPIGSRPTCAMAR